MRIIHLTPGAGEGYYCENCLRDTALLSALRRAGHDVLMVPLYLPPVRESDLDLPASPVFYGGVNVYLQQKLSLFRRTPRWIDRWFDRPGLLRWAGRKSGMTSARDLGQTTLSVLRGEDGRQAKELDRLVDFLAGRDRPDAVVLSNALLVGLARRIRRRLDAPIFCVLQDEDGFLDSLPPAYRKRCWETLAERSRDVDAFFGPSRYYVELMRWRLELGDRPAYVVYNGIDPTGYEPAGVEPEVPTIGFLSRMSADKGVDTLAEAFVALRAGGRSNALRLHLAGGSMPSDQAVLERINELVKLYGVEGDVRVFDGFERAKKAELLRSLSVLSVPTRRGEAAGQYIFEALACGVPLVLPRHGAFPELIECTGGGLLCEPNNPADLARKLQDLLTDRHRARRFAEKGRQAVLNEFNVDRQAREMTGVIEHIRAEGSRA